MPMRGIAGWKDRVGYCRNLGRIHRAVHVRDVHKELLIGIALQLRMIIQPLSPCLLNDGSTRSRNTLCSLGAKSSIKVIVTGQVVSLRHTIQGDDCIKLNLRIQKRLNSGSNVIGVIMAIISMAMAVTTMAVVVVMVSRHFEGSVYNRAMIEQRGEQCMLYSTPTTIIGSASHVVIQTGG